MSKAKDIKMTSLGERSPGIFVYAYLPNGTVAPTVDEKQSINREWVALGKDNAYLERMRVLADNSVALDMCINSNALYLAGKKVVIKRKGKDKEKLEDHEEALAMYAKWTAKQGESEFRTRTMLDVAFANARPWHFIYDGAGELASIEHVDVTALRSGKPIEGSPYSNRVNAYFISENWKRYTRPEYTPKGFPRYDFDKRNSPESKNLGQIQYLFKYKQGKRLYGEPLWMAAIPDAQVDAAVAPFNRNQLDTNFAPTVHIHSAAKLTPEQQTVLAKNLSKMYTGSLSNGIVVTTGSIGEDVKITPLPSSTQAGVVDKVRNEAKMAIVNANQIPAVLANIDISTGAIGNQPSLRQQVQRYTRAFIEPLQAFFFEQPLLEVFKAHGINDIEELYIEAIDPFEDAADEVQQRQAYMRAFTVDQHRANVGQDPLLDKDGKPDSRGNLLLIEAGGAAPDPNASAQ